jgi:hypothetical protein
MSERYVYKGKNLTSIIWLKTEKVAEILAERETLNFDDALEVFMKSRTYALLQDTGTLLWAESSPFIVDDYYREIGTQKS